MSRLPQPTFECAGSRRLLLAPSSVRNSVGRVRYLRLVPRDQAARNEYMRNYMKDWYNRRHAEAITKLGGRCAKCGSTRRLEIDHKDPATVDRRMRGGRGGMWTASEERFQAELAKCQLLCHDCHVAKTLEDRGFKAAKGTHGTLSAYQYCGPPKCEECKAAKRAYMQEYMRTYKRR